MEILLAAALLLWAQNKEARRAIVQSDWFRGLRFGNVEGKELAEAAEKMEALANGGLRALLSGRADSDVLAALAGALGLPEGLASLLNGPAMQAFGAMAGGSEPPVPAENPFAPIANIADPEILYALNRCFS